MKKIFIFFLLFQGFCSNAQKKMTFWKFETSMRQFMGNTTQRTNNIFAPTSPTQIRANFTGNGIFNGYGTSFSYNATIERKNWRYYLGIGGSIFGTDIPFESPIQESSSYVNFNRTGILKIRKFTFDVPTMVEFKTERVFVNLGIVWSLVLGPTVNVPVTTTQYTTLVSPKVPLATPIVSQQVESWTLNQSWHKFVFGGGYVVNDRFDVFLEGALYLNNINTPSKIQSFFCVSAALNDLFQRSLAIGVRYKLPKKPTLVN
ncbi:MAG: hypothetical protein RL757_1128 [Bacteroidota bacterium]|jgi:hypothetical protein